MVEKRIKTHDLYVCIVYLLYRYKYMSLVRVNQSCVCNRNSRQAVGTVQTYTTHTREGGEGVGALEFVLKYVQIVHFYAFFNYFNCALFFLYSS